jgi:hypothetical protein
MDPTDHKHIIQHSASFNINANELFGIISMISDVVGQLLICTLHPSGTGEKI